MRFLSNQQPRFAIAAFFIVIGTSAGVIGFIKCSGAYSSLQSEIASRPAPRIDVDPLDTEPGARLATLELTRTVCGVYIALSATLLAYTLYRCVRPRPVSAL